ncbi:MAG: N-acyl homoserine lactonase family protein [Pseudomonadota bacterium]
MTLPGPTPGPIPGPWEVYALKYATRAGGRVRADSFLFDAHDVAHSIDYYLWLLCREGQVIVVDTGYDAEEGARRGRPIMRDPVTCLADFGIAAEAVETVIVTHLHYDHAGALDRFPAARFHLQAAEMAFATGPCMCEPALNHPFTAEHVCQMVRHVYSGRVVFHDGDGEVAPGVEVVAIGGHSRGLQAVRVLTARGWMMLASDASHFFESWVTRRLFPIVVDAGAMLAGYSRLGALATAREMVIPGHDPLVRQWFPRVAGEPDGACIHRLDVAPDPGLAEYLGSLAP